MDLNIRNNQSDANGKIVALYDLAQCLHQDHEPYPWRMTSEGEAIIRQELELPDALPLAKDGTLQAKLDSIFG